MYLDLWLEGKNMTLMQLCRKLKVQRAYFLRMLKGGTLPTCRISLELEVLTEGRIKAVEFWQDPTQFVSKNPEEIE